VRNNLEPFHLQPSKLRESIFQAGVIGLVLSTQ